MKHKRTGRFATMTARKSFQENFWLTLLFYRISDRNKKQQILISNYLLTLSNNNNNMNKCAYVVVFSLIIIYLKGIENRKFQLRCTLFLWNIISSMKSSTNPLDHHMKKWGAESIKHFAKQEIGRKLFAHPGQENCNCQHLLTTI